MAGLVTVAAICGGGLAAAAPAGATQLAQVGDASVIVTLGSSNRLDFYDQPLSGSTFSLQTACVGSWRFKCLYPGSADSIPAVAQVGDNSAIAVEGPNHTLDYYWQSIGSSTWQETVIESNGANSEPSIAQVGNSAVIAVQGPNHTLDYYWQPAASVTNPNWHEQQVASNGTAAYVYGSSAPSIAQVANATTIAIESTNNSLDFYSQPINTGGWQGKQAAGWYTTYSSPSVGHAGTTAVIAAEGQSETLDYYYQPSNAPSFQEETVTGPSQASAWYTLGPPSIAQGGSSTTVIAAPGPNSTIDYYYQDFGLPGWNEENLPGNFTANPPSIATVGNSIAIAAQVSAGQAFFYDQPFSAPSWGSPEYASGS